MDGYSILKTTLKGCLIRLMTPSRFDLSKQSESLPHVSIIVTVKNEEKKLKETLEALTRIDYPSYEVVLVDGGSNDGTINIAEKFPIKTIQASDSNPGQGRNVGVKNSSGEVVAFIDGDCLPERNWLRESVKLLKCEGVGGVGGPMIPYEKSSYLSKTILNALSTFLANAGSTNFVRYKQARVVKNVPSCNAVYLRETFEEAGSFSDEMRYCEDVDLNHKIMKKERCILYSPDVVVKHNWKVDSFSSLFRFMLKYGAGRAIASRKRPHLRSFLHMVPSISLLFILFLLAGAFFVTFFGLLAELLVFSYFAVCLLSAILSVYRFKDWRLLLIAPLTYVTTHVGYAIGYILGMILREKAYEF